MPSQGIYSGVHFLSELFRKLESAILKSAALDFDVDGSVVLQLLVLKFEFESAFGASHSKSHYSS